MSRIAVTGGSGKLGRAVVEELLAHDHEVVNLDLAPSRDPRCPFVRVDLTDYGQTVEALTAIDGRYDSIDAVVHLAAIPAPGLTGNAATFANNITATHHVFLAARAVKIKKVVWASSETVLGLPFDTPPPYLPVDEDYPARPESAYSLRPSRRTTPIRPCGSGTCGATSTPATAPRRFAADSNIHGPAWRCSSSPTPTR